MASAEGEDVSKLYFNAEIDSNELVKQLEQQLQDLDATEFDLPQVSELPTLESILNEPDDYEDDQDSGSDSEEHISPPESEQKASFSSEAETVSVHSHTSSRGSAELLSSGGSSARNRRDGRSAAAAAASVIRHVSLSGIASQLVSAHDRVGAGLPTTMAVGNVICVGTSHGLIMVFEPSQALKWCLEPTHAGEQHGSVSALALSEDGARLLAGYAKGHLCLYDLITGNLTQSIADAHTACTAVLHLKWTDFPNIAMMSDSGGSVFELSVKRTMGLNSNMSRCIFTGSRGEVCTVEPLLMSRFHVAPLMQNVIVAMATITKVIVVSLRPSPKVLFSHPLRASSSSLPLLAWQFVVIQMPDRTRIVDPVLAFGRQHSLYFYQVTHGLGDALQFLPLRKITTDYLLHNVAWLNPSTMALLDSREQCHVMDVHSQNIIETLDLSNLGLVYASQHFKATATGGNVSKAMAVAGDRACYHSMISFGNQIILLGTKSLQVLTIRTWSERLEQLYASRQLVSCFQLARQMVSGKAMAVVGLPHRKSKRRAQLQQKVEALTLGMLEDWHVGPPVAQASQVVTELVCLLSECGLQSLLLGRVWEVLQDNAAHKGVYLECLEQYILSDTLRSLPPSISQQFLAHYELQEKFEALESCIVRLSVTSLDLHQTMTMCWSRALYDAIIYVYSRGMKDYITPLEELTTVLANALDALQGDEALPPTMVALGNKILVYVSCCLAGRGYPQGDIEQEQMQQVKYEVFKCLSSVHSKNAEDSQKAFPYLRTLLRFDTREFLNVLSLAFEEAEFSTELGLLQRQRLIDILMQVMSEASELFSAVQVCALYTFIARQLLRRGGSGDVTATTPAPDTNLIDKVVSELCSSKVQSMGEERQTALLELLQEGALQYLPTEALLHSAKQAQFWRVCESVYVSTGQLEEVLGCYVRDPSRLHQALPYLHHAAAYQTLNQLQQQLLQHFKTLVELDAQGLAALLLDTRTLTPIIPALVQSLHPHPSVHYAALKAMFDHRSSSSSKRSSVLTAELQQELVRLMCSLHPQHVLHYLKHAQPYHLETMLQICREFDGLQESEAYLLLQSGRLQEALQIHITLLAVIITKLKELRDDDAANADSAQLLEKFETKVRLLSSTIEGLCRKVPEQSQREELWFPLLDLLLAPPTAKHPAVAAGIGESCGSVVSTMLTQVSPPSILERVLQEQSACQPDHVLKLMQGLVSRYRYERRIYSAMSGAVRAEQLLCVTARRRQARAPVAVVNNTCSICGQRYISSNKSSSGDNKTTAADNDALMLQAYRCGHSYHKSCASSHSKRDSAAVASSITTTENAIKNERIGCIVCNNSPSQISSLLTAAALRKRAVKSRSSDRDTTSLLHVKKTTVAGHAAGGQQDVSAQHGEARGEEKVDSCDVEESEEKEHELTSSQREALSRVYQLGLTGCRVAMLDQLSQRHQQDLRSDHYSDAAFMRYSDGRGRHDQWLSKKFPLRLAPPINAQEYVDL